MHAYCGGLWVTACEAVAAAAGALGDAAAQAQFADTARRGRLVYQEKLWNGRYLDYDSSDSDHHDSIMVLSLS